MSSYIWKQKMLVCQHVPHNECYCGGHVDRPPCTVLTSGRGSGRLGEVFKRSCFYSKSPEKHKVNWKVVWTEEGI